MGLDGIIKNIGKSYVRSLLNAIAFNEPETDQKSADEREAI